MSKIKFLKFTRYSEWWEYKLIPLLGIAYLTVLSIDEPFEIALPRIALLFGALIVGAIYVSIINDVTDIKEDEIARKRNSMANLPPVLRLILVFVCLIIGALFILILYPDVPSMIFQALSYLVFTLYSVRPVRLKKRGFWGVLCDASGAHLFPSLLITTNLIFYLNHQTDLTLTVAIAAWSLMYGLRGILWHQFFDRDNDIRSGTTTFAAAIDPLTFKKTELSIVAIELLALSVMLCKVFNIYIFLGIASYVIFIMIRRFALGYKLFIIISPKNEGYQLLLNDYYFVFLPLSFLLTNALTFSFGWLIILAHILVFPNKIILLLKDVWLIFKKIVYSKN